MSQESTLKSEYTDIYEICYDGWSDYLLNAEIDLAYYCGAQFTPEEMERADEQGRTLHTIDKIARQVNLLHGYEIRNRHILKIGPVGMPQAQEDEACRQHTAMIMALMARNGGYSTMSNSFKWGTLVQGSNLLEFWRDRLGLLQFDRLGYNQFLLNPTLTKTDLSDCDDILIGRWISEDKVKMLVPTADIKGITPLKYGERWRYLGNPALGNKAGSRMFEQWWKRKIEYIPTVISRVTGQEMPFKDFAKRFYNGDERFANRQVKELTLPDGSPALSKYSKPVDTIRLTVLVDGEVVWDGVNPLKMRDYNFVWFHGDWCPESPRDELKLRSFTRRIRQPQRAYNRRMNQIYDIIESQIQAGRIARSKYLMNPEDAYKSGQGVVLHAKADFPDTMALSDLVYQFTGSDVAPGLFQALEMTDKAETDVGGLNEEIFGTDDKDIPGILHSYRTGQALTGQAGMFQGFRDSKSQVGKKAVRLVQLNYSPQRVAEILNELPVQDFYKEDLTRFDCTPVEGLLTDTQQQLFYQELKLLRRDDPVFQQLIPASLIIKYFPGQTRQELIKAIQQSEQQQAQLAQKQLQDQQRMNTLIEAQAAEDIAQAEESRTGAAYDRARTMAEINKLTTQPYVELIKEAMKLEGIRQKQRM
jgi:hypothetical protein